VFRRAGKHREFADKHGQKDGGEKWMIIGSVSSGMPWILQVASRMLG